MRKTVFLLLPLLLFAAAHAQNPPASHSANLAWTYTNGTADPGVGFNVFRIVKGSSGSWTMLNTSPITLATTSYTDATVATGVDYLYYVTAVDAQGNQSNPSNTWDSGAVPGPLAVGSTLTGTVH